MFWTYESDEEILGFRFAIVPNVALFWSFIMTSRLCKAMSLWRHLHHFFLYEQTDANVDKQFISSVNIDLPSRDIHYTHSVVCKI